MDIVGLFIVPTTIALAILIFWWGITLYNKVCEGFDVLHKPYASIFGSITSVDKGGKVTVTYYKDSSD